MEKIVFTGNEVVILDDNREEFSQGSAHVERLSEAIRKEIGDHVVIYTATTPEAWNAIHHAEGSPLLVLHDWDISELYQYGKYFPYTTVSSIKDFIDRHIPIVLYTGGTLERARQKFAQFTALQFAEKGDIAQICSIAKGIQLRRA
jgi:hypothetical protein